MRPRTVLARWQEAWQPLPEVLQERFLARPEVHELAAMGDETVIMSIRAHERLVHEVAHARWLRDGRRRPTACGCEFEAPVVDAGVHRLVVLPGPDTRVGGRSPRSATVVGRCSCGWERRAGSRELIRTLWDWHVQGDDEEPVEDW
jgi:hypothetical protein